MTDQVKGKTIVITGATSGIGLAAAKLFIEQGASVIGVGRSDFKINQANDYLLSDTIAGQLIFFKGDLGSQSQVSNLGKEIGNCIKQNFGEKLDVLVNNAGVYMQNKVITEDGIEYTFAVNHLASFLLSYALMPLLLKADKGKIITISSYAHYNTPLCLKNIVNPHPYLGLLAYKQSKLCNVLFTRAINQMFDQISAVAVDPGLVNTEIGSKNGKGLSDWVWRHRRHQGISPEDSAQAIVKLAFQSDNPKHNDHYFRRTQPKKPSKNAQNDRLAKQLWHLSNLVTNIKWQ